MRIVVDTIPHKDQRYETPGDWVWETDGTLHIYVSDMGDENYNFLVANHELQEAWLCKDRKISPNQVDKFDINFESNRKQGDDSEPGDDVNAPYRNEHCIATGIERILCAVMDISWKQYEEALNNLARPSP